MLEETDPSGNLLNEYIFLNGERVARVENEYLNNCPQNYKFTGKERDPETGLDEFGARYYSSTWARFTIPDWDAKPITVPYAKFGDPQTLNLYSYVENEPVNRADADGHFADNGPNDAQSYLRGAGRGLLSGEFDAQLEENQRCGHFDAQSASPPTQPPASQAAGWSPSWQASASVSYFTQEVKGAWDVTGAPLAGMALHPIDTIKTAFEGLTLMAEHPIGTFGNAGAEALNEMGQTATNALHGDPRAVGQVVGFSASVGYAADSARNYRPTSQGGPGGFGMNFSLFGKNFVRFDTHQLHFGGNPVPLVPHMDFRLGPFSGSHIPWPTD